MKKFAQSLTRDEVAFARRLESAGVCSYSQAVKRLERGEAPLLRDELATRLATVRARKLTDFPA